MSSLLLKMKFLLSIIFVFCTLFGYSAETTGEKLPESMREIVAVKIPKIEAKGATLRELVDFIAARIRELDPHKPSGISFLTCGFGDRQEGNAPAAEPKNDEKKFNYSRENVSVAEVFVDLARLCQVEFHITSVGVVVTPIGSRPFPNNKADKGEIFYTYKQTAGE
jgi:hypothetical protein